MSASDLAAYLERPRAPVESSLAEAVGGGPIDPGDALPLSQLDRLLDPAPVAVENGWCALPDGVGYVAVRVEMPAVTAEMVDWWFDWHPRDPVRYRIWHPQAHRGNSLEPAAVPAAKAHWGTVHHPVEDVGAGVIHARIAFCRPTGLGFSTDGLDAPDVGTIVCGYAGDDSRHMRHTVMAHVFLDEGAGQVLRSRFWIGAAIRPYARLAAPVGRLLNNRLVRRALIRPAVIRGLAVHCAEEYTNLATLLPELYERFGPSA